MGRLVRNEGGPSSTALAGVPSPPLGDRAQLGEEVASFIRELIMTGQLRSGDQLNIEAIARDLKTSATPVREALLVLKGEGFVQVEPRRGFRVAPLARKDVEDMFLVQAEIAGELAGRAARVATPELLEEITRLQEAMRAAGAREDGEGLEQLNFEFHRMINRSASSPKLAWLLGVVVRYVPRVFYSAISGWQDASLRDHEAIIDAFKNHDPESARTTMAAHIHHVGELLVSHLESQGFWASEAEA